MQRMVRWLWNKHILDVPAREWGDETRNQANWKEKIKKVADQILPHSILLSPLCVACGYIQRFSECASGVHNGGYPSTHTAQSQHSGYSAACQRTNWDHNGGNQSMRMHMGPGKSIEKKAR